MLLCHESPRWLARQDHWEKARKVLSITRHLPPDHSYIEMELQEMADQLEMEVSEPDFRTQVPIAYFHSDDWLEAPHLWTFSARCG